MKFCEKCQNTGGTTPDGDLDCTAPGCEAATQRAEFNRWLLQMGWRDGGMKEWAIYRHGLRDAEEACALHMEALERQLKAGFDDAHASLDRLISAKNTAEQRVSDLTEAASMALELRQQSAAVADTAMQVSQVDSTRAYWAGWSARAALDAPIEIPAQAGIPSTDPVIEKNVQLLRSRSAFGIEKYGTTLADSNVPLRGWLEHALLEVLDCANYMQKAMQVIDAAPAPTTPAAAPAEQAQGQSAQAKRQIPPRDEALCNDGKEPDWAGYAQAEAQQGDGELPRAWGVSRDAKSPGEKSVLVSFDRRLTDDELRALHERLAQRAGSAKPSEQAVAEKEINAALDRADAEDAGRFVAVPFGNTDVAHRKGYQQGFAAGIEEAAKLVEPHALYGASIATAIRALNK